MENLFKLKRTECQNRRITWTIEQNEYLKNSYEKGKSLNEIGRDFNVAGETISKQLKRLGIETRKNGISFYMQNKFPRNSSYFSNEQFDESRAYWLGFLYADGCVHGAKGSKNTVSITLKDKEHLEKFSRALENNNKISVSKTDGKFKNPTITYHYAIIDEKIWNDLNDLGCVPNKSYNLSELPNLKEEYMSHFLRGYFDGDGSLHYKSNPSVSGEKVWGARISFTGSWNFIESIHKYLSEKEFVDDNKKLDKSKSENVCQLQVGHQKEIYNLLKYLYKDSTPETRLDRKYNIYQEMINDEKMFVNFKMGIDYRDL